MESAQIISSDVLLYYMKRIYSFLESDKKSQFFPNISKELENVLMKIVADEDYLNVSGYDDDVKAVVLKITAVIEANKNIYKLGLEHQCGVFGKDVLVYQKTYLNNLKILEPLRKPGECQTSLTNDISMDNEVTTNFKLRVLNATVKFVKDDGQKTFLYPEMATTQAEFIMTMLSLGKEAKTENTDVGFGYKCLYAALWESMKIFSLKYEYRIEYVEPKHPDMKQIIFEKIPKRVKKKEDGDGESVASEINNTTSAPNLSKIPDKITNSILTKKNNSTNNLTLTNNQTTKQQSNNDITQQPTTKQPYEIKNLIRKMQTTISNIENNFIEESLEKIKNFLAATDEASIIFPNVDKDQVDFLKNVRKLSKNSATYMLFSSDSQKHLDDIRHWVICHGNVKTKEESAGRKVKKGLKNFKFIKIAVFNKRDAEQSFEVQEDSSDDYIFDEDSRIETISSKQNKKLSKKEMKRLRESINSFHPTFIQTSLEKIHDFLSENSAKELLLCNMYRDEVRFLKCLHLLCRSEGDYHFFEESSQTLLSGIKVCLAKQNYTAEVHVDISNAFSHLRAIKFMKMELKQKATPEAIKFYKTVPKEKVTSEITYKRETSPVSKRRSLSANPPVERKASLDQLSIYEPPNQKTQLEFTPRNIAKAKMLEALSQPVQSDKAMKMMLSMGWKGGALGMREDGITEPLMPALDLATRAGLGHTKPISKKMAPLKQNLPKDTKEILHSSIYSSKLPKNNLTASVKRELHIMALESVLDLVSSEVERVKLVYSSQMKLTKSEYNFVMECARIFNRRKLMQLPKGYQTDLALMIQAQYENCHGITLAVHILDYETLEIVKVNKNKSTNDNFEKCKKTSISGRHYILAKILDFYKSDAVKKEITLNASLTSKIEKIQQLVVMLNNDMDIPGNSVEELVGNIKREMEKSGTKLSATFVSPVLLLLEKIPKNVNNNDQNATNTYFVSGDTVPSKEVENNNNEKMDFDESNSQKRVINDGNTSYNGDINRQITDTVHQNKVNLKQNGVGKETYSTADSDENEDEIITSPFHRAIVKQAQEQSTSRNNKISNNYCKSLDVSKNENGINNNKESIKSLVKDNVEKCDVQCNALSRNDKSKVEESDIAQDPTVTIDDTLTSNNSVAMENTISNRIEVAIENTIVSNENCVEINDKISGDNFAIDTTITDEISVAIDTTISGGSGNAINNTMVNECDGNEDVVSIKKSNDPIDHKEELLKVIMDEDEKCVIEANQETMETNDTQKCVGKRSLVHSPNIGEIRKKSRLLDFKTLYILPTDYPAQRIDNNKARVIQTSILKAIDYTKEKLPLLTCHGIQNGCLTYSCHDENSVVFMENLIKTIPDFKIVYDIDDEQFMKKSNDTKLEPRKLMFRINTFIEEDTNKIFKRLELFNTGLKATNWTLIKKEQYSDFIVIYVEVDDVCFNYVSNANFVLFSGNDLARFSIVWD